MPRRETVRDAPSSTRDGKYPLTFAVTSAANNAADKTPAGNIFMTISREINRLLTGNDLGGRRLPPSPGFSACCKFFPDCTGDRRNK